MPENRIQREVEELLRGLDTLPPRKRPLSERISAVAAAPFRAIGRMFSGVTLPSINAGHVLLFAMIVIAVWYVAGGSGDLWRWVIIGAVALFIGAFIMSLRRHSRPPPKYWRDKPMELRRGNSWWDRWRNRR